MRITIRDRVAFPVPSQREITPEGYLKVPGRVARVGIQQYLASELGLTDRPPGQLVNVYRPPEEVFKAVSLASYDNMDVTIDHPDDLVDSTTFKEVTAGHAISSGRQDGDYVVVDLLIKDQQAIDEIDAGKAELSAGYTSEYDETPGTAPDGTPYEFIQRDIKINHIALCDQARAGHKARLFDNKPTGVKPMPFKVVLDSGVHATVAEEATAQLIQASFDGLKKRIKDAEEEKEKAEAAKDQAEEKLEQEKAKADAKDEEIAKLKKETSEDSISTLIAEIVSVRDSAAKIAGDKFACDSLDPMKIRRAALDSMGIKCKQGSWDKASDAYVLAYFDAEEERKESEDDDEDGENKNSNDSLNAFTRDMKQAKTGSAQATRDGVRQSWLDKRYGTQEAK
ncbi:DUF2213 domain-containing protein [Pectobacterium brasiliense]|uniref:DUF2213 domain-containing protein n=1 Tax=Pectobacterium brasiliense TaxID=180957 RepID=UPI001CE0DF48|nr:DUF2213 domain-containing protein [Pectobacterium brasiliense]MCA5919259.1 DUF2213 domain-containing protein [Pectobacterium brasiliense]MCA5926354.1 DUF2213 domain-containing protein [Pectobacterium brasiliense]MCA5935630.1 DUF2213 domain-containing protein [Pectobacterium brasiliense]MCA5941561.1 DUF2213 domain-containing protein [Pectobacterium brasiliense]MCA5943243.1 DUF2213 domain-containing protein [Pectobacterium brasiliense]